MKGLYVPLVTPFFHGKVDVISLKKLVKLLEPHVDGFVPCLSSGEGDKLSTKEWEKVATTVVSSTSKPVFIGILQANLNLIRKANKIKCEGIVIPTQKNNNLKVFKKINKTTNKKILIYNTEFNSIKSIKEIQELDKITNIIAIKDSSMNPSFFNKLVSLRKKKRLRMSVLQGMENLLLQSKGCDGYLISLLNVEPKLCKQMFIHQTEEINNKILNKFWEYNLGGNWFVSLKATLYSRKIIKSSEQVKMEIKPK